MLKPVQIEHVSALLPKAISLLLLLTALGKGGAMLGLFTTSANDDPNTRTTRPPATTAAPPTIDPARITQASLFGTGGASDSSPELRETRPATPDLDIRFLGVVAATGGEESIAILEEAGRQRAYGLGDRLNGHPDARLTEILAQRVLIDIAGRSQQIELEPIR